jgi:hypothetical protein
MSLLLIIKNSCIVGLARERTDQEDHMTSKSPQTPAEFDAAELALMNQAAALGAEAEQLIQVAHREAGDIKSHNGGFGRRRVVSWQLSDEEALTRAGRAEQFAEKALAVRDLEAGYQAMEAVYRSNPWTRYFPCRNADGHIHSSERGCQTVRFDTDMGWAVQLSGQDIATAVAELGETLCSVCFPDAPARWCRTRSEVTRAEREAARAEKNAARDAKLAVKNLTAAESAELSEYARERVTTVAAAKAIVREAAESAVELEWIATDEGKARWAGMEDRYAAYAERARLRNAEKAGASLAADRILFAREAAAPGTGWTLAQSVKSVEGTIKRTRKGYGL